jgi:hypothetical protein
MSGCDGMIEISGFGRLALKNLCLQSQMLRNCAVRALFLGVFGTLVRPALRDRARLTTVPALHGYALDWNRFRQRMSRSFQCAMEEVRRSAPAQSRSDRGGAWMCRICRTQEPQSFIP